MTLAPQELAVADIEGVQKILVRDDMIKSDLYEMSQISTPIGRVSAIMNERDRIKYKRRVRRENPFNNKSIVSVDEMEGITNTLANCATRGVFSQLGLRYPISTAWNI